MPETKYFSKDITLSAHSSPPNTKFPAKLAYWTFGSSSNPAILLPTCYSGTLASTLPFLYSTEGNNSNPPLPPSKYFIIVVGLLGGSESSSPSNTPEPWNGPNFPKTSYEDNVRLQHALCTEELGVQSLKAYIGFSMGGQQAYHFATVFPDFVDNVVALATSARTSWHNWCFLEGPKHALITAHDFHVGDYKQPAKDGVRAFGRVYSTWALSQEWFRRRCWREPEAAGRSGPGEKGFETLEEYLEARWSAAGDANDLLAMLWTWQKGDITVYETKDEGDLEKTLGRAKPSFLIMPCRTDTYFPPEDSEEEVRLLGEKGELVVIESVWGHLAGGGGGKREDNEFIKKEVGRFLGV